MLQTALFSEVESSRLHNPIVNVASVPQRSPFRYPGGKTWLVPVIRQWLKGRPRRPVELIEPFAGGAIVSLTAAFENLTDRVTMVERDDQVSAVWETILNGGCQRLANQILCFDVNHENVQAELAKRAVSQEELAFQTILRNRINHGGILAPGSGVLKRGENGKGIKSRWYPETLYKRLVSIQRVQERIRFIHGDGLEILRQNSERENAVFLLIHRTRQQERKLGVACMPIVNLTMRRCLKLLQRCAGISL